MRGHILIENEGGRRSLYVPEAHIQVYVVKSGLPKWIVVALRTDGYHAPTPETAVLTIEHLRRDYRWTVELDVPQHLVAFAVESERRRQEEVGDLAQIFTAAVETGDAQAWLRAFQAYVAPEAGDQDFSEETEDRIGAEFNELMAKAGGPQ